MAVLELGLAAAAAPIASAISLRTARLAPLRIQTRRTALAYSYRTLPLQSRWKSESVPRGPDDSSEPSVSSSSSMSTISSANTSDSSGSTSSPKRRESAGGKFNLYGGDWEDSVDFAIKSFEDLPHRLFGVNQHMIINYELKEALRIMLRQFNAPIVYCFAYGSGVFPQEDNSRSITEAEFRIVHPKPPEALVKAQKGSPKMIDFIFGVSHTQHWHSINMKQHRNHYSGIASLGSGFVSRVQDWGAGVYFNPYIEMNGMLIKYGVTSIDNLVNDLSTWDNLYLAGRLQKPVKILRDHPQVRLANQHNLIAAVRTALLLLPPDFTETELYSAIAGLSYLGDPRMALPTENKSKVSNIVNNNVVHFRRLYAPLVKTLPNVAFTNEVRLDDEDWVLDPQADSKLQQDMDPVKRGNMVRRLPRHFRSRLYFQYQKKFAMPREEFTRMMEASSDDGGSIKRRQGGEFEKRIARDDPAQLQETVRRVIKQTVNWPSTTQSIKGVLMGGWSRSMRYLGEKVSKWKTGRKQSKEAAALSSKPSDDHPPAEKEEKKKSN
ncbi:Phosphatidate cytidylyltransferase, mitochondrial [Tolypocladium ophioglossoides CBS 100239]|uniref:Phosphatidate cytidylyltransferase, mitochondrial n=1 Tax=Tolypocladium ophioglossoides (strain CBS 100239) TaxID=1163406 RepID=A0A0L0NE41_TOLOC|nr:Phosphatidate cytidylyltransferase, mitochondrial [Tolypocladium ophioglossoides CBS 100239]